MIHPPLDDHGRFILDSFGEKRPFASFLPGIAGPTGIPLWVFYVNRGQAIASFGIENKDNPIVEFQPANKAYQLTPTNGFRTFLKLTRDGATQFYEPFAPWSDGDQTRLCIGMNELALRADNAARAVQTSVQYVTLSGEPVAGLVRQLTITNTGRQPLALELLDGLPAITPYGVDDDGLKNISRTLEAWMRVDGGGAAASTAPITLPFYRLQASAADTAEVTGITAGHFYLAFTADGGQPRPLPAIVDPELLFGHNTSRHQPDRFLTQSLAALQAQRQITRGRTPCGFFGATAELPPGASFTLYAIVGHAGSRERLGEYQARLAWPEFVAHQQAAARRLTDELTAVVATQTGSLLFDAYCRQTFLDNVLRGGWPLLLGPAERPFVYHIYSRKHGDPERDYNAFYLAAEPYSQGNGNYRDVNQNRRCDVLLNPRVDDFNVLSFLSLIQTDGYNPLVVNGSRFTLNGAGQAAALAALADLVDQPERLAPLLAHPFTPGQLLRTIADHRLARAEPAHLAAVLTAVLAPAEQSFDASFGEGYWIDHWFYNLDLIDSYLAVYPDRQERLLFKRPIPYYDSPATIRPRARKHLLVGDGQVRQYDAVFEDEAKEQLIASRRHAPHLVRDNQGQGAIVYTSVYGKLVCLALTRFAALDPGGMGIEMEANKPGWYDALNGLPGLFGSSLCESYELERLLAFLVNVAAGRPGALTLPTEQATLLRQLDAARRDWSAATDPARDHRFWEAAAAAREAYREQTYFGLDGQVTTIPFAELAALLTGWRDKVQAGIDRAVRLNDGIPPTYFAYTAADYTPLVDENGRPQTDPRGRPYVAVKRFEPAILPLFLEGPVHALRRAGSREQAAQIHQRVRQSPLFDAQLGMYKVNAPLASQSHEIGRARAFTPGWLENESIWLHMAYKYLLALLQAGLYEAYYDTLRQTLIPFLDPAVYGRSPLENSSFIVSSAHPDESLHGAGFVARLSGSTAEFLSLWTTMLAGERPFQERPSGLHLALRPILPGWLFASDGTIRFTFLGHTAVTYHNPARRDTFAPGVRAGRIILRRAAGEDGGAAADDPLRIELDGDLIPPPYAAHVRDGAYEAIDVYFG